jgi:hypothetical protein
MLPFVNFRNHFPRKILSFKHMLAHFVAKIIFAKIFVEIQNKFFFTKNKLNFRFTLQGTPS